MIRFKRFMLWLIFGYIFCGCSHLKEVHSQEQSASQTTVEKQDEQHVEEVRQAGPETITTTVEEYEYVDEDSPGAPGPDGGMRVAGGDLSIDRRRVPPQVVKRTVVVDQRAPVTDTKTSETKGADTSVSKTTDNKTAEKKEETKTGPSPFFWLAIGGALVVAFGVCWKLGLIAKAWGSI